MSQSNEEPFLSVSPEKPKPVQKSSKDSSSSRSSSSSDQSGPDAEQQPVLLNSQISISSEKRITAWAKEANSIDFELKTGKKTSESADVPLDDKKQDTAYVIPSNIKEVPPGNANDSISLNAKSKFSSETQQKQITQSQELIEPNKKSLFYQHSRKEMKSKSSDLNFDQTKDQPDADQTKGTHHLNAIDNEKKESGKKNSEPQRRSLRVQIIEPEFEEEGEIIDWNVAQKETVQEKVEKRAETGQPSDAEKTAQKSLPRKSSFENHQNESQNRNSKVEKLSTQVNQSEQKIQANNLNLPNINLFKRRSILKQTQKSSLNETVTNITDKKAKPQPATIKNNHSSVKNDIFDELSFLTAKLAEAEDELKKVKIEIEVVDANILELRAEIHKTLATKKTKAQVIEDNSELLRNLEVLKTKRNNRSLAIAAKTKEEREQIKRGLIEKENLLRDQLKIQKTDRLQRSIFTIKERTKSRRLKTESEDKKEV